MAARCGSMAAVASALLVAAALTQPAACSPFTDILAAIESVTDSLEAANSSLAAAGGGATVFAAAAGLGVRNSGLEAAHSTKSCSHTQPTAAEEAAAAPALAAASLFVDEENAAYVSSALFCSHCIWSLLLQLLWLSFDQHHNWVAVVRQSSSCTRQMRQARQARHSAPDAQHC